VFVYSASAPYSAEAYNKKMKIAAATMPNDTAAPVSTERYGGVDTLF
jgi:hypothetical protein